MDSKLSGYEHLTNKVHISQFRGNIAQELVQSLESMPPKSKLIIALENFRDASNLRRTKRNTNHHMTGDPRLEISARTSLSKEISQF
jgi:hypothetical protein